MEEMLWGDLEVWIVESEWELPLESMEAQGICRDLTKEWNGERRCEILNSAEAAADRRLAVGQQSASRLLTHG